RAAGADRLEGPHPAVRRSRPGVRRRDPPRQDHRNLDRPDRFLIGERDMAYRVTAGYVTVETQINEKGSRAQVDIPRGVDLPGDAPQEQVETLLRLGRIEEVSDEATADKWDPEKPLDKYTVPQLK